MKYDRAFFDRGLERRNTGCEKWDADFLNEDTLPLWVADMDFACAEGIQRAMLERVQHPCYGYNTDEKAYSDAFIGYMERHHRLKIREEEMLRLPCVVTGLKTCVQAFSEKGDQVAIFTPCYGPFAVSVNCNERELVSVPLIEREDGGYDMNLAGMEKALQDGAKLVLLCNPHNPASRCWKEEEIAALAALCEKYSVVLVSDEIHADFVYQPDAFTSILHVKEKNVVALFAASKTFNVAGLQQAQLVCKDEALRKKTENVLNRNGVTSGNTMALAATMAAYNEGDEWLQGLMAYLDENRKLLDKWVKEYLPKARLAPISATYLGWIDLRAYGKTCDELTEMFKKQGVALTGGTFFGTEGEGFMRINFGCPSAWVLEGIKRMAKALEE